MRMLCHLLHTLHFMFHIQMEQKVNMSNLIGDSNFVRQNTSASQKDIQSLFDTTGSPLRNNITIYKKNSKGSVYNTGVSVTPAKIIYDTSVTYSISPKVILATLQRSLHW